MVLTMFAERRNSPSSGRPSTSRRTVWVRLPWATAAMARVTSVVGRSRSSISVLTETSISPQAPRDCVELARSRVRPSLPTTWPTRLSSLAICWLAATMSLKVSAILPARPVQAPGRRTEKSPSRMECRLARIERQIDGLAVGRFGMTVAPRLNFKRRSRICRGGGQGGCVGCTSFHHFLRPSKELLIAQARNRDARCELILHDLPVRPSRRGNKAVLPAQSHGCGSTWSPAQ